jgi:hypothetical protein
MDSFSRFESMLVSAHTVQLWTSWRHVPDRLQKHRIENENCDFIYFVPKVVANNGDFDKKYPLCESDRRIDLDDGVLFVSIAV